MTDEEIRDWLHEHEGVHPKEISARVGLMRKLLPEILRLRRLLEAQTARNDDIVGGWGAEVARLQIENRELKKLCNLN